MWSKNKVLMQRKPCLGNKNGMFAVVCNPTQGNSRRQLQGQRQSFQLQQQPSEQGQSKSSSCNESDNPSLHRLVLHFSCVELFHKERGESQSHLITPGCVTVKLKSPIRVVFVALCCGQFCHSSGCNVIHLKQIVCVPYRNIKQPRQGSPNCWRNIRNGSQVNSPCSNFLPRRNEIWICVAWTTATEGLWFVSMTGPIIEVVHWCRHTVW